MMEPHLAEVSRHAWVWALEVPHLPDVAEDGDQLAGTDLLLGYRALAEGVAARPPASCAVQIRLCSTEAGPDHGSVRALLLGRGRSLAEARDLYQLTTATLPPELGLEPVTEAAHLDKLLGDVDPDHGQLVEIRRRIEDVSALPTSPSDRFPLQPAVLRWSPQRWGLRQAGSLLAREQAKTVIVLHMEPARASQQVLDHLEDTIREVATDVDAVANPLRLQVAAEYRQRLRSLSRAALQVRVLIAGQAGASPALAATVGMALALDGAYQTVHPGDEHERYAWWETLETLSAPARTGDAVSELSGLADSDEAARVVRFPLPAAGGSTGLRSQPLPALPRAAEPALPGDVPRVDLGSALGGGRVSLTLRELNQHLLVAGLPGFGKTVTTQTILSQLWLRHRVPFLVLDPAKSDYQNLVGELGSDLRLVELGPDQFAFNPFGVPDNCARISHAGRVLAAFDAAFQLSAVWPGGYVTLARAMFRAYEHDVVPTLDSLREHLAAVIDESGFSGVDGSNIRAALLGRMDFLVRGPLGVALSAPASAAVDYAALAARPTVVGLRGFSGPTERALVFGLLLAGLISYRESNPIRGSLGHVTVLEEAHRLLGVGAHGVETEGVRLFVEAIAELRGSGEGFVVVDQAPTLLHAGVLKLAGSYCAHRLVDSQERSTVGSGLLLSDRQIQDLARLRNGQAVIHSPGRTNSVVTQVEPPPSLLANNDAGAPATALPWQPSEPDRDDLSELFQRVARTAPSPARAMLDVALELQRGAPAPDAFRRDLIRLTDMLDREVARRQAEGGR